MTSYPAAYRDEATAALIEQLKELSCDGAAIDVDWHWFSAATNPGARPLSDHHLIDLVRTIPIEGRELHFVEMPPPSTGGEPDAENSTGMTRRRSVKNVGITEPIGLDWPSEDVAMAGFNCLLGLREKLGKQIIGGRENRGELLGVAHLDGKQHFEIGILSETSIADAIVRHRSTTRVPPQIIVMNHDDAMTLIGPFGGAPQMWGTPIMSTDAVDEGSFILGDLHRDVRLRVRTLRVRVRTDPNNPSGSAFVDAWAEAATQHLRPWGFGIVSYEPPKLLTLADVPVYDGNDIAWEESERAAREGRNYQ